MLTPPAKHNALSSTRASLLRVWSCVFSGNLGGHVTNVCADMLPVHVSVAGELFFFCQEDIKQLT
jgi:hypothetical protein